jgi:hypothetical protein
VDTPSFVQALYDSGVGEWMRLSLRGQPIVEALHVLLIAVVFGTIMIVDLRLLGFPNVSRSFARTSDELLKYTWIAFGGAVITGVMLFTANAFSYYVNTAFRIKLVLILLAGINMVVFQLVTAKTAASWDKGVPTPTAARVAGFVSLVLWVAVVFFGRWIGFTKGYDFAIPEEVQFEF